MDEDAVDEDAVPCTFELGDLAWSRVGTAPYWPSVICHDPDTKKFTQVKESKRHGPHRVFHLKFFGGQRGKRGRMMKKLLNFQKKNREITFCYSRKAAKFQFSEISK